MTGLFDNPCGQLAFHFLQRDTLAPVELNQPLPHRSHKFDFPGHIVECDILGELLQRPTNEKAMLVMPVGYPAADAAVPDLARKPLEAITVWK